VCDLDVVIGEEIPQHAAYITVSADQTVRVAVSAQVEAPVLAALHPAVAESVVAFLERRAGGAQDTRGA
jgi:hypothetical protein